MNKSYPSNYEKYLVPPSLAVTVSVASNIFIINYLISQVNFATNNPEFSHQYTIRNSSLNPERRTKNLVQQ